jgi:hypothetical protein
MSDFYSGYYHGWKSFVWVKNAAEVVQKERSFPTKQLLTLPRLGKYSGRQTGQEFTGRLFFALIA